MVEEMMIPVARPTYWTASGSNTSTAHKLARILYTLVTTRRF